MVKLPKLPDPDEALSIFDKASNAIGKGLGFIDKIDKKLDQFGLGETSRAHLTHPQPGGVSLEETVAYQKREVGKLLLRMERHYSQRLRIKGIPCDCGAQKHLLDLESLSEETIPMVDNPQVYYSVLEWIKKVGPKSTDEAAKSGTYDQEYPGFSHEARDFRKEIIGSLDPTALFPQKPGEPVGARILPVVSEEEREEIKQRAIKKIEEVLR